MSLGGLISPFEKKPTYDTISNVKSVPEDTRLKALYGDYDTQKTANAQSLDDFIAKYTADNSNADSRTSQDIGSMDQFFNGDLSNKLADLRNQTKAARSAAVDRAVSESQRRLNASRILSDGGGSSYDTALSNKTRADIMVPAALQDVQDQRNDLNSITQGQLALVGKRQQASDANTARLLTPGAMQRQQYMQNLQALTGLGTEQRNNTFYGLQKQPTALGRIADWSNNLGTLVTQAAGIMEGSPQKAGPTSDTNNSTSWDMGAAAGGGQFGSRPTVDDFGGIGGSSPSETPSSGGSSMASNGSNMMSLAGMFI